MLNIFPTSPMWANMTRLVDWAEEVNHFDSGVRQASTPWSRPLNKYSINAKNFNEIKQSSLYSFVNTQMGMVTPFLFKDPYDYKANNATQPTSTNMASGSGFYFVDERGYQYIPDSASLYVSDPASGQLLPGSHFVMSQDNGWCTVLVSVSSIWVSSFEFFRKGAFETKYAEASPVWNSFSTSLVIQELLPNNG